MRRVKDTMLGQGVLCAACRGTFEDYRDAERSHLSGKGLGGGSRDDSLKNLVLLHTRTNREQGSMPFDYFLKNKYRPEMCL